MPQFLPQIIISLVLAIVSAAVKVATAMISKALAKKKSKKRIANKAKENKQNITDTIAAIPVVYGRARTGCSRVFVGQKLAYAGQETYYEQGVEITADTRGEYLYTINAFCIGEIDDIEQIKNIVMVIGAMLLSPGLMLSLMQSLF